MVPPEAENEKLVLTEAQMEVLANPLRSKMVLALRVNGPSSISALAERMALDAKTLYYPLKKLIAVGIVRQIGSARPGRRTEAVYSLAATRIEIPTLASLEVRQKLMRTTLRSAEQEVLTAQAAGDNGENILVVRAPLWLAADDRQELFQRLNALLAEFSARSTEQSQDLLMLTTVITPIVKG